LTAAMASLKHIAFNHFLKVMLERRKTAFIFGDFCDFRDPGIGGRGQLHIGSVRLRFWHSINQMSTFDPLR
jgi:hypothetical protein